MQTHLVVVAALAALAVLMWPAAASLMPVRRREGQESSEQIALLNPIAQALAVLETTCTMLRAGTSAPAALSLAVEPFSPDTICGPGWRELLATARADGDVPKCWETLAYEWDSPDLRDVASAWRLSSRHGCPLADALEAAAANLRAGREHAACVRSAVAGARATVGVLVGLPVLGMGFGPLLGVDLISVYLGRSALFTLLPGLGLMAIGIKWVGRQTRRAVEPVPVSSK